MTPSASQLLCADPKKTLPEDFISMMQVSSYSQMILPLQLTSNNCSNKTKGFTFVVLVSVNLIYQPWESKTTHLNHNYHPDDQSRVLATL